MGGKGRSGAILSAGSANRKERIPVVSPVAIAGASVSLLEEAGQAASPRKVQARMRPGARGMVTVRTGMRGIRENFVAVRVARLAGQATCVQKDVVATVSGVGNEAHALVDVKAAMEVPVTKIAGRTSVPILPSHFIPRMPVLRHWRKQSAAPVAPLSFLTSQRR